MGKTDKPNVVESDSGKAGKAKSSKGAPKARKTRGRTVNRRRERAMRKALLKINKAKANNDLILAADIADQLAIMKIAHERRLAKMGVRK